MCSVTASTKAELNDEASRSGARILGGVIFGTHSSDMISEIALAIEMGADAVDIGKTIHPLPILGESIGMAAEVTHDRWPNLPIGKHQV
jgi:Pyridine nucleotide-disulphide oxidoreductase, dimerisation domain